MPKPDDCGCGKGPKKCISKKKRRGGQEPDPAVEQKPDPLAKAAAEQQKAIQELAALQQQLISEGKEAEAKALGKELVAQAPKQGGAGRDAGYLLGLYMKECGGKPKLKGVALKKDMMKFAKKTLKKMDCGCGCEGQKTLSRLSGGALRDCPSGYSEDVPGGLACIQNCPAGLRGDAFACRGCPEGWTDMGLTCAKLKWGWVITDSQEQSVIWRDRKERIDWAATAAEIQKGFEDAFSADGPLARAFDPEKNGVSDSFRKFGENTEAAFKDLGEKMEKAFDPNQNGVGDAFRKFGDDMSATLGNDQWWRDTMSDPDTYIFIIGAIASVAAIVLSGGTAGPGVIAALSALGPSLNMISAAAQGKPIDPLDIAGLALAIIPGVGQAVGGFDDAIKAAATAGKAAGKVAQTTQLGKVLATATSAAGKIGSTALRTGLLAKLDKVAGAIEKVIKVGSQGKALLNPKVLIQALMKGDDVAKAAGKIPWKEMTKAQKIKDLTEKGMKAYKAGKYAIKAAKFGEGQGLYSIPDIETALAQDGDEVDLNTLDPDNLPGNLDYVATVDEGTTVVEPPEKPLAERKQSVQGATPYAAYYNRLVSLEKEWNSPKGLPHRKAIVADWNKTESEAYSDPRTPNFKNTVPPYTNLPAVAAEQEAATPRGGAGRRRKNCPVELNMSGTGFSEDTAYMGIDMAPLEGAGAPRSFEQMYVQSQADIHRQKVDMVHRRAAQRTVKIQPYTERPELLSDTFQEGPYGRDIHGQIAGGFFRKSRAAVDTAKTGVDFWSNHPLFGGGDSDGEDGEIAGGFFRKSRAAVDTAKTGVDFWSNHPLFGGGAYRGAFTRGEPQAGEAEEKFYYPAFSGREARGVAAGGDESVGPSPMGSSLAAPTLASVRAF